MRAWRRPGIDTMLEAEPRNRRFAVMVETLSPTLPPKVERLAHLVARVACDRQISLVTAESCTGGLMASLLTDVEGFSHAFERGFVTYTDEAKRDLLGVSQSLLNTDGAVSRAVARAMAVGGLAASKGDICLAITGFAGRGAPGDEPGLVFFALAAHGQATIDEERRFGDLGRGGVRLACLDVGLRLLLRAMS